MAMVKTPIEIDQEALTIAAEVLGTTTKKDTVNAALREVGQRLVRLRALARLGEMADRGDFDEFLEGGVPRLSPALFLIHTSGLFGILQSELRKAWSDQLETRQPAPDRSAIGGAQRSLARVVIVG